MIPHLCPFELEIKMAEREGNSDSQELEDFISAQKSSNTVKKTKSDIRALKRFCSTIDETREPETMTAKELDKLLSRFFDSDCLSRVINLLLTKLARDRTRSLSALGLFCTDLAALGPYCQDLGPIFSQYGPRAWLIRCIYTSREATG